jgi:hypothetical protein
MSRLSGRAASGASWAGWCQPLIGDRLKPVPILFGTAFAWVGQASACRQETACSASESARCRPLAPQPDPPDVDRLLRKRICQINPLCLSEYRSSVARHVRHGRMTASGMSYRQEVSPGREASPEDSCARRKLHFEELGDEIVPLNRAPRLQDVQGLLTTRGRHASCGIAQDDGGVSPRAEDRQWDGEVAASHPLRGGSLDPDAH